ncbi:glycosyltransferase family 34 protein [Exserohilum turcica Et28A]|uniref:Glycosyltransferase family 34 protein n=1 Tax=Exserohilum turcicum (strain 28A) TaxID=671987 RepID=R0JK37_EXST2|nr:glycosyltransferase family 34 protein [Exserohilum turcica Et28A]EOA81648.1 glycosyltransferase family 34 protein [Exserohilum turcica Et28A]
MLSNQLLTKRYTLVATALIISIVLVASFRDAIPIQDYRNFAFSETVVPIQTSNNGPQPAHYKTQPEWNWVVPKYASSFDGYARKPRNKDVIVLTASDGLGHNSEIPNLLDKVLDDRAKYCAKHGYTNLWLNTSRYDVGDSHRVWSKIPALAEAFYLYPSAEWVWLMDADMVLMNHDYSLVSEILSPAAIDKGILRNQPLLTGSLKNAMYENLHTPSDYRVENIDILLTQDHHSINAGSVFFRRSAFTRFFLEAMTDTMLTGREHGNAEQDAILHMILEHELVRKHVGVYPQRKFNSYTEGGDKMGYKEGDLAVHFAGCWVEHNCVERFNKYAE